MAGLITNKNSEECIIVYNAFLMMLKKQCTTYPINSSPPGQNGRHFADIIFRCIFVNEKFCILIKISLKFVPKGPIDNYPAFV